MNKKFSEKIDLEINSNNFILGHIFLSLKLYRTREREQKGGGSRLEKKVRNLFYLFIAFGIVLLAGCSSDNTEGEAGTATEGDKSGGTLVYGRGADSVSLDPVSYTHLTLPTILLV